MGAALDEDYGDMVGGEYADIAVVKVEGGKVDVLDELVEVEKGVCRTARRMLWIGRRFEKSEYLNKGQRGGRYTKGKQSAPNLLRPGWHRTSEDG